ncbi:DUF262 domain-containing protein, partial [Vibrio cholerae]|uniref:DUF262 domain-containing protein n=1 Tax=Vibrio cholerae TaxID=666 RepID=UPI00301C2CBD
MARTHRIHSGLRMASRELETLTRDRCLGRLRDDAAYQRGYVWQDKDKQNFLDAVFELRPIGEIALLAPNYSDREYFFMLVDGKQRVNTLCEFFSNNLKWRGRYFD